MLIKFKCWWPFCAVHAHLISFYPQIFNITSFCNMWMVSSYLVHTQKVTEY